MANNTYIQESADGTNGIIRVDLYECDEVERQNRPFSGAHDWTRNSALLVSPDPPTEHRVGAFIGSFTIKYFATGGFIQIVPEFIGGRLNSILTILPRFQGEPAGAQEEPSKRWSEAFRLTVASGRLPGRSWVIAQGLCGRSFSTSHRKPTGLLHGIRTVPSA